MNIKVKYFLFVAILHIILTILVYQMLKEQKFLFILSETLIIASLIVSYLVYKSFIRPIELMKSGTNAIKDEDFNIKYLKTGSSEVDHLIETYNDMMDRLRVEKKRSIEQSYFLETLIEESPMGVVILDFDNNISEMNEKAQQFLTLSDKAVGRSLESIQHPLIDGLSELEPGEKTTITLHGHQKFRCRVQSVIHKGFQRKFLLIEELSEEIMDAERQAYGKVIRMMAHEVNNSIGAINSILDTVRENAFPADKEDSADWKHALQVALERNQKLNYFMKNFAKVVRIPEPDFNKIDLNELARRIFHAMKGYAGGFNIELEIELAVDPVMINGDASLLEQVIVNAIKNAIESIGQDGQVKIITSKKAPQLSIIDNGKGISEADKEKIFTPFYSTKPEGQGIGLMLTKEILSKHRANFDLYTEVESGWTKFEVGFGG